METIQANELRINSTYNSVKWKQPVKLELSDFMELYHRCEGAELDSEIIAEMFEPIELTEEWIDKTEFKKYEEWLYKTDKFILELDVNHEWSFRIRINDSESIFLRNVKYLHRLQNLILDLTSKELNIKES